MIENINKRFAIIGVAGYIALRHLKAIKSLGQNVVSAHDLFDSVGVIDSYFPDAYFTTNFNSFMHSIHEDNVDYLTVCTPNYLHCPHTLAGLEAGVDVICEKPLALTCEELNRMDECRKSLGHDIWTILQLRLHPEIVKLKQAISNAGKNKFHDVDLAYITPRGRWYAESWKSDLLKSGGLVTNIGVHFIDMLHWIFGPANNVSVHYSSEDCVAGYLELENARVRFFLSINPHHKPDVTDDRMSPYRQIIVDGKCIDFTSGFTDLHRHSYFNIINGSGFSINDVKTTIYTLETIRNAGISTLNKEYHPLLYRLRL